MSPVEYLVARNGVPPSCGLAYDYVLGGDGLYVAAEGAVLRARVPVAPATVRGLPPLYPSFSLPKGRIARSIWEAVVAMMRAQPERELMLAVVYQGMAYRLVRPPQVGTSLSVVYQPPADAVLEIHSHRHFPACFSRTDDADEQGFRVYGVVGRLDRAQPEVALRVGVYGHVLPLAWEMVFAGDKGPFRDVGVEPEEGGEIDDDVHH